MKDQKLVNIIKHYIEFKKSHPDKVIEYSKEQKTLNSAIKVAVLSKDKQGIKHNHQYLIKETVLKIYLAQILTKINIISQSKDFDELYTLLSNEKIKGIGKLTIYDVSNRIGYSLNLKPTKIYLHQGTKIGVEKIIGKVKKDFIEKSDLPIPFQTELIDCDDIENILCIYKKRF